MLPFTKAEHCVQEPSQRPEVNYNPVISWPPVHSHLQGEGLGHISVWGLKQSWMPRKEIWVLKMANIQISQGNFDFLNTRGVCFTSASNCHVPSNVFFFFYVCSYSVRMHEKIRMHEKKVNSIQWRIEVAVCNQCVDLSTSNIHFPENNAIKHHIWCYHQSVLWGVCVCLYNLVCLSTHLACKNGIKWFSGQSLPIRSAQLGPI